jgi:membrane protease YdiL (CAAX protease family)
MNMWYVGQLLVVVIMVPLYYSVVDGKVTSWSKPLAALVGIPSGRSYNEGRSLVRLSLAGGGQLLFWLLLLLLTGVIPWPAITDSFHPLPLVYGVLLGIGEMALSSFLCHVLVQAIVAIAPGRGPTQMQDWLAISRGGWMREYLNTIDTAPLPAAILLTILYVSVEELVFRGTILPFAAVLGVPLAVAIATLLFAGVQVFQLPSWRSALFPVVGALVMGLLHSVLFLSVPNIIPLIVAHCVFFMFAVL